MRARIRRRHEAQVRAHNVCTEHGAIFENTVGGRTLLDHLGGSVTEVARLLADQQLAIQERRAATHDVRQLRRELRSGAKVIVRIGRLVKVDEVTMSTMRIHRRNADGDLAAYLEGLIGRVSPYAGAFEAAGLPSGLLQTLADRLQVFVEARGAQTASSRRFTAATESIRAMQAKTQDTVAALEAIAAHPPGAQPELLTKLRIAKRVGPRVATTATPEEPSALRSIAA